MSTYLQVSLLPDDDTPVQAAAYDTERHPDLVAVQFGEGPGLTFTGTRAEVRRVLQEGLDQLGALPAPLAPKLAELSDLLGSKVPRGDGDRGDGGAATAATPARLPLADTDLTGEHLATADELAGVLRKVDARLDGDYPQVRFPPGRTPSILPGGGEHWCTLLSVDMLGLRGNRRALHCFSDYDGHHQHHVEKADTIPWRQRDEAEGEVSAA